MKVLVVGGGGREHALAWKLARSAASAKSSARPAMPGSRSVARIVAVDCRRSRRAAPTSPSASGSISPSSVPSCRSIAASSISFTSRGLRIFGPSRAAAQLECSKVFAKAFMARHGIPTARYRVCDEASARPTRSSRPASSAFRSSSRPTGSRPARASSSRRIATPADCAVRAAMDERQFGDAGCARRARGMSRRARKCRSSRSATAARASPLRVGAGSQAHLRRRRGAEHRRHGRVRAEPARGRRDAGAHHARDRRSGRRRAARRRHDTAGFSTPA